MLWAALDGCVNGVLEASPRIGVMILLRYSRVLRSFRHMGPQPLSRVNPYATTKFDTEALLKAPELAVYPMAVISRWARIDSRLAELLSSLLHTPDLSVAMAMFQALIGGDARRAALAAAAAESLAESPDDYRLFEAVLKVIGASRRRRHDFAHNLWGMSPDIPDALLLVDPRVWVRHYTKYEVRQKAKLDPDRYTELLLSQPDILDRDEIWVFRKQDLEQDATDAETAEKYVLYLSIGLDTEIAGGASASGYTRKLLLSVPAIQQAFEALSRGKKREVLPRRRLVTRRVKL